MITNDKKNEPKRAPKFYCEKCDYSSNKLYNWERHIVSTKHKMITNDNKNEPKRATTTYKCMTCGKIYKYQSGLSRHNKTRFVKKVEKDDITTNEALINILKELIKSNNEPKVVNNNISINVFLNQHCKDAMNLTDFVDKLQVTVNDLLKTKSLGYVGGISNILLKNLREIPSIKRPIHCSDTKRLKFYVKEDDEWNKDSGDKVDRAIDIVAFKQIKKLQDWESAHPDYLNNTELMNTWNTLVHNIMGGVDALEREKNKKNIKKKVGETLDIKNAILRMQY
jgi:DNA-directed RNA polymerase subunit RPC12/RpoP